MCMGAIAISESNMGEGQVIKKAKCHILSSTFSATNNNIYWYDQALMSVCIMDGKGGYAN